MRPFFLNHNLSLRGVVASLDEALSDINGNTGNSYIAYAVARALSLTDPPHGIANIFQCDPTSIDFDLVNREYTHAFLILQDHLGPSWNSVNWPSLSGIIKRIKIPLVVFSLGMRAALDWSVKDVVEGLSPAAADFFRLLDRQAVSIGIRGSITAEVLSRMGIKNFAIVGCPTYFEAGPGRRVEKAVFSDDLRIGALGGFANQYAHDPIFVLQSEEAILQALLGKRPLRPDEIRHLASTYPDYTKSLVAAAREGRTRFFIDIPSWKRFVTESIDLGAGTRMHGSTLCLNVGRPVIVTAGDFRAREMCALFGIPHYDAAGLTYTPLTELVDMAAVDELNARYDALYDGFTGWLVACGLTPTPAELEMAWAWTGLSQIEGPQPEQQLARIIP